MQILLPGTPHYITWNKQNLLDSATYYPQAVIKHKQSEATLATLDLESFSSDRYGKQWNVVQDPTGQGREISIIITIYEDANHTQVSRIYGAWETDYLIYQLRPATGGGGGTDYNVVRRILKEELGTIKIPEQVDLSEIFNEVSGVKKSLSKRLKELFVIQEKSDKIEATEGRILDNILKLDTNTAKTEKALHKATQQATDAISTASEQAISRIEAVLDKSNSKLTEKTDSEMKHIVGQFKKIMANEGETIAKRVNESVEKMNKQLSKPLTVSMDREKETKEDERVTRLLNLS